jgi:hypothetical protein
MNFEVHPCYVLKVLEKRKTNLIFTIYVKFWNCNLKVNLVIFAELGFKSPTGASLQRQFHNQLGTLQAKAFFVQLLPSSLSFQRFGQ